MERKEEKNLLIFGYYREWTRNSDTTSETQYNTLKDLTRQMEVAAAEKKDIIMMGDMNLCAKKWTEESFKNKHNYKFDHSKL